MTMKNLLDLSWGENGQTYFFHASNTNAPFDICVNKMLTFHPTFNQKGFRAENIVLGNGRTASCTNTQSHYKQSQPKRKKFVLIHNTTVNLNDVKTAKVEGDHYNAKLLIKTYSSGTLVENYYDMKENGYNSLSAISKAKEDLNKLLT